VSGDKTTRKVFRMLMPWNDEKEALWLADQEKAGWHLAQVNCFGYRFERAAPGDFTYRLDFGPPARLNRQEYFDLFGDAGWEHLGNRGLWQFFRKASGAGQTPEIYTDPQSRIAMYRRVIAFLLVMLAMLVTITSVNLSNPSAIFQREPVIFGLYLVLMGLLAYGTLRLAWVIRRLKRSAPPA
jgi:hypothetical protein